VYDGFRKYEKVQSKKKRKRVEGYVSVEAWGGCFLLFFFSRGLIVWCVIGCFKSGTWWELRGLGDSEVYLWLDCFVGVFCFFFRQSVLSFGEFW